jgi:hypothetical protein
MLPLTAYSAVPSTYLLPTPPLMPLHFLSLYSHSRSSTRTLSLDNASPATRLLEKRRQMFEVQEALEAQKQEFAKKVRVDVGVGVGVWHHSSNCSEDTACIAKGHSTSGGVSSVLCSLPFVCFVTPNPAPVKVCTVCWHHNSTMPRQLYHLLAEHHLGYYAATPAHRRRPSGRVRRP